MAPNLIFFKSLVVVFCSRFLSLWDNFSRYSNMPKNPSDQVPITPTIQF